MTHFNQYRQFPRTVPLFDPHADEIVNAAKAAQATAEKIAFALGAVIGAGLTLIIVSFFS